MASSLLLAFAFIAFFGASFYIAYQCYRLSKV